jgi:hypothetical protein
MDNHPLKTSQGAGELRVREGELTGIHGGLDISWSAGYKPMHLGIPCGDGPVGG